MGPLSKEWPTKVINSHICNWIFPLWSLLSITRGLNAPRTVMGNCQLSRQPASSWLAFGWEQEGQWGSLQWGATYKLHTHPSWSRSDDPVGQGLLKMMTHIKDPRAPWKETCLAGESQGQETDAKTKSLVEGGSDLESHYALLRLTFLPHLISRTRLYLPWPFP